MKRFLAGLGAATFLLAVTFAWAQTAHTAPSANSPSGTWELVSSEWNGQPSPANQKELKMLSPKHFMWVIYDKDKMKTVGTGNGTWTLNGSTYTEHVDFIDIAGGEKMMGTDATFTLTVDGSTMTQSGTLGETKMKEVWKRLD